MAESLIPYPTLIDVTNEQQPDGRVGRMAEILSKKMPILKDIPLIEGNMSTGHQITSRTALPAPTWRQFNEGVVPTLGTGAPIVESCGLCEAHHNIDTALLELNGNSAQWRANQDAAFGEGIAQDICSGLFYYTRDTPQKFFGLSARYNSTSGTTGAYCLKAGTTTSTGVWSAWLINWSPTTIYGIYPRGGRGGLQMNDKGEQLVQTSSTTKAQLFMAVTQWKWNFGLCVEDYRSACRGVIDQDDSTVWATTTMGIPNLLDDMCAQIYSLEGNPVLYMSRTLYAQLNKQLRNKNTTGAIMQGDGGKQIPGYNTIPIRIVDSLVSETVGSTGNFAF